MAQPLKRKAQKAESTRDQLHSSHADHVDSPNSNMCDERQVRRKLSHEVEDLHEHKYLHEVKDLHEDKDLHEVKEENEIPNPEHFTTATRRPALFSFGLTEKQMIENVLNVVYEVFSKHNRGLRFDDEEFKAFGEAVSHSAGKNDMSGHISLEERLSGVYQVLKAKESGSHIAKQLRITIDDHFHDIHKRLQG